MAPISLMSVHRVSRGMKTHVQDMCHALAIFKITNNLVSVTLHLSGIIVNSITKIQAKL